MNEYRQNIPESELCFCLLFGIRVGTALTRSVQFSSIFVCLTVEFLLKTGSRYPNDTGVTLFNLATLGNLLRYNTHRSGHPLSPVIRLSLRK